MLTIVVGMENAETESVFVKLNSLALHAAANGASMTALAMETAVLKEHANATLAMEVTIVLDNLVHSVALAMDIATWVYASAIWDTQGRLARWNIALTCALSMVFVMVRNVAATLAGKAMIALARHVLTDALGTVLAMELETASANLVGSVLTVQVFLAPIHAMVMDNATMEPVAVRMATEETIALSRDVLMNVPTMESACTMGHALAAMGGSRMIAP